MTKHILFTGGGTAGHVIPNLPLITAVTEAGWKVSYIGEKNSVEEAIMARQKIPFYSIKAGKLRRYFSLKTIVEPFRIMLGVLESLRQLRKLNVDLVFSKGGFVAFPVVVAAWCLRIPVIAHESDKTPGLANRLCYPFVSKLCVNFKDTAFSSKAKDKICVTGTPIRAELFAGSKEQGLDYCGFNQDKPCLLVMGGSLGALSLNRSIRQALPSLTQTYQIVHLCGKGKMDNHLDMPNYRQFEYIDEALPDILAMADVVISRSGANALYELLALQKPHILVPLSKATRGDQLENAAYFEKQGISTVILEDALTEAHLLTSLQALDLQKEARIGKMKALNIQSATPIIVQLMKDVLHVAS